MSAASRITQEAIRAMRQKLHPNLRTEQWYTILATASAAAHVGPETIPLIYAEAAPASAAGASSASAARTPQDDAAVRVQRRLKEALLKGAVLYGIPPALDSVFALIPHLREEARLNPHRDDKGFFLRKHTDLKGAYERGREQLGMVYRHNLDDILAKMGEDMNDIKAFAIDVNYGWNLSETGVLDFPSTELVILSALIPLNLRAETLWHLRGCRRAGWSDEEIDSVRSVCIDVVQEWGGGGRTDRVPTLDEVKEDSNE